MTVAVGRFIGSHHADVAVGAPQASVVAAPGAGVVTVLPGDPWGVDTTKPQILVEGALPDGYMQARDGFGSALVAGSFGHGGHEDLVIGSEGQDVDLGQNAGAAYVFYGGAESFYEADRTVLSSTTDGYRNSGNSGNMFGYSLGRADLNGDGRDDVVVGAPGDDVGGVQSAGSAEIYPGQDGPVSRWAGHTT
ncbi:integrin alpha [Kineococcus sp. SYSU DK001]|uniref:integrin alpha n=1 Tax=Kineococcus sp. SYSU DK001 TaxID=3383122 RepID=UPI003D7DF1A8